MTAVSSVYAQRFLITIFLISFGIYLFLATVTYTPFDPGWMHISSDTQQVSNASGVAGAWIADLLFGFLGWASLLIPILIFFEAIQVWWPRSFLSRPFRYAAKFFIILTSSSLLYLLWNVPADTLDNASGGIIGYELGQSLSQLLSIYGAVIFLVALWLVLFTLAFGIQWNKTWATLKATPAYLQELFYKNVPESESAYDRTAQAVTQKSKARPPIAADDATPAQHAEDIEKHPIVDQSEVDDPAAQRLFNDMLSQQSNKQSNKQVPPVIDDVEFEATLARAHQLEQDTQRVVPTGEVWKALQQQSDHKSDIDALLRAAQDDELRGSQPVQQQTGANFDATQSANIQTHDQKGLDWDNDLVFDELLSVVPQGQTATDIHRPFQQQDVVSAVDDQASDLQNKLAAELDELAFLAEQDSAQQRQTHSPTTDARQQAVSPVVPESNPEPRTTGYAQSSAFVAAPIATSIAGVAAVQSPIINAVDNSDTYSNTISRATQSADTQTHTASISDEEKQRVATNKDAFRDAWLETAGPADGDADQTDSNEDFDFDAPLTDASGRPMSRAMQVAHKRRDLPTLPDVDLLDKVDPNKKVNFTAEQLARLSELLEIKLQEFNVKAKVIEAQPGPVVTRFELDLAPGVKASKVTNISRDLARSMSMASVRVVEVIPGKPYIGVEVPNSAREMVRLIELLDTPEYRDPNALISMAMGKDISGNPVLADLAKAPHMLVAGTTGSGKSVAVNAMILSMLLKYTPDQLRLILIDPKQLELANYNDIPHLLTPVVTDMKDAVSALNWCVNEMERRYKLMSFLKIRKISDYNRKVDEAIANGEDLIDPTWKPTDSATQQRAPRLTPLPSIVIVADEFADMIMQVGKKAEEMITRLAQKSRAAGIHLLLATQRPSVDVITGLIKANIPTRVALRVNSKIDSRTILDAGGAEDLLGHGDMLFLGPGKIEPERVHGAFISDDEVNRICDAWRERGEPDYVDEILTPFDEESAPRGFEDGDGGSDRDALYDQCVAFVLETRKASTSSLQRKFSLGYNRAARIIDQMEENGIVSGMGANGKRDILV
ncbi:S-DNA-T family DNA segregation ATPase FtsK/SpoIIIE [Acinetobacter calcoaceticus]|uniref:DNA translocase FtsK n=1 Tax=Acinetobacter calcoaceticus TaxID=471 RepID=A0A4R1Y623_ACICA|nr:S-DNA-T family DNA segregation ATPase FtsK/SpoIIIE [Acinetobacter calcoaceticus]